MENLDLTQLSDEEMAVLVEQIRKYDRYKATHRAEFITKDFWHPWQQKLFKAGANRRERMALAGNRTGKTLSGTYEVALHLTGRYPDWWEGLRFDFPINCWALGVDGKQVREVIHNEMFGTLGDQSHDGTGWVERDLITGFSRSKQTVNLAESVMVKHVSGGESKIAFKAYSQSNRGAGTTAFAGSSVDLCLVDEQPSDPELHGQLVTRTMTGNKGKGGSILYTMTPELGETELVHQFLNNLQPHQYLAQVTWDDCPHLTPKIQEEILASVPSWQHDMRRNGLPFMGSGRIYTVAEDRLRVEPFEIPDWWTWLAGIDFGVAHPTAWAKLAYNPESDTIYVVHVYRQANEPIPVHAAHIKANDKGFIPTIYPHDAGQRDKGSGKTLAYQYREAGVNMYRQFHNLDKDKTMYVEPGIAELDARMRTDRFKVFATCPEFFEEYRRYHRDEKGIRVDLNDDVLAAVRYAAIMIPRYGVSAKQASVRQGIDSYHPNIEV